MTVPAISDAILACLKAPGGGDDTDLELAPGGLRCRQTGQEFPEADGVPSLFVADDGSDVTGRVRAFYEEFPFPNYDGIEDFGDLVRKGRSNLFSATLLDTIGFNKLVLECGCGTGQLSHFLQLNNNHTLGIDMTLNSLGMAVRHKQRNQLVRSSFVQMNIFNLAVKDASFDVVISKGVLHSTADPRRAFSQIVRKVKPGGLIVLGLYNWFARVPTWVRSKLIGVFGPRIDYVVRSRIHDPGKVESWVKDQYYHPHETWHSIDEVLDWFEENDVEYLNCSPAILGTNGEDATDLAVKTDPGSKYQRIVTQLSWLATIAREGALFDVIGRKR